MQYLSVYLTTIGRSEDERAVSTIRTPTVTSFSSGTSPRDRLLAEKDPGFR